MSYYIRVGIIAVISAVVICAFALTASAGTRFNLYVQNAAGNDPVTFSVSSGAHNCYGGNVGLGRDVGPPVDGGKYLAISLYRDQRGACDGEQGQFDLIVSSHKSFPIHFSFSNDGGMYITTPNWNQYGNFTRAQDGGYIWTVAQQKRISAGRFTGTWERLCDGFCNKTIAVAVSSSQSTTSEKSTEVTNAITASLNAGFEVGGFSAGGSVESSWSRTYGSKLSRTIASSRTETNSETVSISSDDMNKKNIRRVWQWVLTSRLSNGQTVEVKTDHYTCSSDLTRPNWLPETIQSVDACIKGFASGASTVATSSSGASQGAVDAGYVDQGYVDQGYVDQGYVDQGYVDQGYVDQGYVDQGYVDQGYVDQGYVDQGYDDQGYVDQGYVDQGYVDQGYDDQGYVDQGYVDQGYADQGYDDQGYVDEGYGTETYEETYDEYE